MTASGEFPCALRLPPPGYDSCTNAELLHAARWVCKGVHHDPDVEEDSVVEFNEDVGKVLHRIKIMKKRELQKIGMQFEVVSFK